MRSRPAVGTIRPAGVETSSITAKCPPRFVIREPSTLPSTSSRPSAIAATIPGRSRPMALTAKWPTRLRYAAYQDPSLAGLRVAEDAEIDRTVEFHN